MTSLNDYPPNLHKAYPRRIYLRLLEAALKLGEVPFAQEAAIHWLGAYPGDLEISYFYAQALHRHRQARLSLLILDRIVQADIEFSAALELQAQLLHENGFAPPETLQHHLTALGNESLAEGWGQILQTSRQALFAGNVEKAEGLIRSVLGQHTASPLVAATHLQILDHLPGVPLPARRSHAEYYSRLWPECLVIRLLLADWLMESGETERAVNLLHQSASDDVNGQVVRRLWGENHPYHDLWPENLELELETPIPSPILSHLGWNRLPPFSLVPASPSPQSAEAPPLTNSGRFGQHTKTPSENTPEKPDVISLNGPAESFGSSEQRSAASTVSGAALESVQYELEQIAVRLRQPELIRQDGRFPVYILFSTMAGLEKVYGKEAASQATAAMKKAAVQIQSRPGWDARVVLADQKESVSSLGISPARADDAWSLKLTLADLDEVLAKKGEMIGALLIVGGPEVVPFHHLPNPIEDMDEDVPSDNPYGTRGSNYFLPEWPVGRLPGGAGESADFLIQQLEKIAAFHLGLAKKQAWLTNWFQAAAAQLRRYAPFFRLSFGYTAEVWQEASALVFRPIGDRRHLYISPPPGKTSPANGSVYAAAESSSNGSRPLPAAPLAYFNLHGLEDAPEWYGQSDPRRTPDKPDYPVALRPSDLEIDGRRGKDRQPEIVFSEACYGANILGKALDDALCLKFLESGCRAVVGSTKMAYGSVRDPLIAADLLGRAFWVYLRKGLPAGEALRQAKIALATEMDRRQGYLDGEDQKTLISFVLYGDPLAVPTLTPPQAKSVLRFARPLPEFHTICDQALMGQDQTALSHTEQEAVRKLLEKYLPGMQDAVWLQPADANKENASRAYRYEKGQPAAKPFKGRLVRLSKTVMGDKNKHTQLARLTFDSKGNLVKFSISR